MLQNTQPAATATSALRDQIVDLAQLIIQTCPPSAERRAALRHLDAVAFYAFASAGREPE